MHLRFTAAVYLAHLISNHSSAHLALSLDADLLLLPLQLGLEQPGAQNGKGALLVRRLGPLLLAEDADARGPVHQVHCSLHLVHVLPTGARCAAKVVYGDGSEHFLPKSDGWHLARKGEHVCTCVEVAETYAITPAPYRSAWL